MKTFKQFLTEGKEFDKDEWLSYHNYTKNADGSIDILGDVKIAGRLDYELGHGNYSLTSLPFKFNKITGNFSCFGGNLTSLEGSPRWVGGNFDCSYNNLTTLEGGPEYVGGYFDCSRNKLTDLHGSPLTIKKHFISTYNLLRTINCTTKYVGGYFDCMCNDYLRSLDGLPEHIDTVIHLDGKFSLEDIAQAREKAKNRKYIRTLKYDDEIEGIGDIFD